MANTYTQIYIHIVFTVAKRECLIEEKFREQFQAYITGIIQKRTSKLLSIYIMPDHAHILIGYRPDFLLSSLVRDIKAGSSQYINEQGWFRKKFNWQHGYGAFSYSRSQISHVCRYIMNQPEHHKRKTFKEEYLHILNKLEINYEDKYLFEWFDN